MNGLLLCSGIHRREGWKTLDANPNHHPDFIATLPSFPAAVKDIKWDEVEWIHGITSFYPWDAEQILTDIRAMLRDGGKLTLEQPDFRKAGKTVEWLFGDQTFREPLIMNRWAYTPDTLGRLLKHTGFSTVAVLPARHHMPARDFRIEACR